MNSKLYSVNELSEILNISKQAIYKRKKYDPILKPFWTTINNVLHLNHEGLDILKSKLAINEDSTPLNNLNVESKFNKVESKVENTLNLDTLISSYQAHIEDLRVQLNSKDNQIRSLNDTISTQSELIKNMQILLKDTTNKNQLRIESSKKSIITRFFKRR